MAKKTNCIINGVDYYRIRAKIGVDSNGKNIIKPFYGSSKKEAEAKRDEYLQSLDKGFSIDYDKLLFSKMFEQWFEVIKKPSVSANSFTRYEATFRLHIKPSDIYMMKLMDIKGIHVQKLINKLPTPNTADRVHLLLTSFFKYCLEEQYLVRNPLVSVKLPKVVKPDKKEFLERDEIAKLSKLSQDDFIFVFAAFTGMRQGEILALTHSDIDFEKGLIYVSKSVKRVTFIEGDKRDSRTLVKEPKTKSGVRVIPLLANLVDPLKKQIALEKEKHLNRGVRYYKNTSLLFSSNVLTHRRGDHVLEAWKKLQANMFDEPVTFHALRHTFCTMLCDQGVPMTTAAQLMGHSTTETVARIYAHFMRESPKEAVETLSAYFKAK